MTTFFPNRPTVAIVGVHAGYIDADRTALAYMEDAYAEMDTGPGGSPAGFAGKAICHAFEDCSDNLHRDVAEMIEIVDAYLARYDVPPATEYHDEAATIRMYQRIEKPQHARLMRARAAG